jgi:hypothetical protein
MARKRKKLGTKKIGDGYRIDIPVSECAIELSTGLPNKVKDCSGIRQGRLTAKEFAGFRVERNGGRRAIWLCECDCGKFTNAMISTGDKHMRSCGCLYYDVFIQHGASGEDASPAERKVYNAWWAQYQHCYNPKDHYYPSCGGRGIKVCDRWLHNFSAFLEDVGLPPTLDHVLTRIDYDKDFEPGNMQWMHCKEHAKRRGFRTKELREISHPMIYKDELIMLVEKYPGLSMAKYCDLLAEATGIRIGRSTMYCNFKKLGLPINEKRVAGTDELIMLVKQ